MWKDVENELRVIDCLYKNANLNGFKSKFDSRGARDKTGETNWLISLAPDLHNKVDQGLVARWSK